MEEEEENVEYENTLFSKPGRRDRKKYYNHKHIPVNKNVRIYLETKLFFSAFYLDIDETPISYEINKLRQVPQESNHQNNTTTYQILNMDTLDMAQEFRQEGYCPLVLNMASKFMPGGGVAKGSTAQEEVIFRRTNAFMTHPADWYPMNENEVIYSPSLHVIRDKQYNFLPENKQFTTSLIAVPAICKPVLRKNAYANKSDLNLMRSKIESIFKIGLMHKHDSLVLGALGCGAYRNPSSEVSQLFSEMCKKYKGSFKKIGFAILVVKSTDTENLLQFREELNQFNS